MPLDVMSIRVPRKTLKSSWNPWRTKIRKHQCESLMQQQVWNQHYSLQYQAFLGFGLEEDDFFVL